MLDSVYGQLRQAAGALLRRERDRHTLQPTALVNEAWLRIASAVPKDQSEAARARFVCIAGRAMRQVLVDYARRRSAGKRGRAWHRVTLCDDARSYEFRPEQLLDLEAAMARLEERSPELARLAELHLLCGLSVIESGAMLGLARTAAKAHWTLARAMLHRWLTAPATPGLGRGGDT